MSTDDAQHLEGIEDIDFGSTLVNELLEAFQTCGDVDVERREFKECRTEMFSEAFMYSRHLHPTCLDIVERVRAIMDRFYEITTVADFMVDSDTLLRDCEDCHGIVSGLVEKHTIVMGTLIKLKKKVEREKIYMDDSAERILSSARKHLMEATRLRCLGYAAVIIPPVHERLHDEAEKMNALARNQHDGAQRLKSAVQGFETLLHCHNILYTIVRVLATALNSMMTEMRSIVSAGKSTQSSSKTAERGFASLKRSARSVVRHCDTFINTRITYPETMRVIGADEMLTADFELRWKYRLKITDS